jgi:hypothetical protein
MFVVVNELADNFGRTSDEKSRVPVVSMTGSADVWWFWEWGMWSLRKRLRS